MMTYEITEKRAREIRGELERRRGTLGQEAALQADSSEVK